MIPRIQSRKLAASLWIAVIGACFLGAAGAEKVIREYKAKAFLLLNFSKFTTWPANTAFTEGKPFVVGVLGDDPFGRDLEDAFEGETFDGHPVQIRKYNAGQLQKVDEAHMLFISKSEKNRLGLILKALKGLPVLTVSDIEDFAAKGGHIGIFRNNQEKLDLEINRESVRESKLRISSQLLDRAHIVEKTRE